VRLDIAKCLYSWKVGKILQSMEDLHTSTREVFKNITELSKFASLAKVVQLVARSWF
jgi:hypothetical protein